MKHNKKRNSALLYEFLVRHISDCVLNNKQEEAKKTLGIVKKYFSKDSPLSDELRCIRVLVNTKGIKSPESARRVIGEVYNHAKNMNVRQLDEVKSKLIADVNKTLANENVYNYKVPNYKLYASAQVLLNNQRNKKTVLESVEKIRLEDVIAEHLMDSSKIQFNPLKVNPTYNKVVCNLVVKKFNEKYGKALNENQMKLLSSYVVYLITENNKELGTLIQENVTKFKNQLKNINDEQVSKDNDLMKKLDECYRKLVTSDFETINEENIVKLLQYMKLVEEVRS
jgi:hypothetical protein